MDNKVLEKSSKKKSVNWVALLSVSGVALLFICKFQTGYFKKELLSPANEVERMRQMASTDRQTLASEEASDVETFAAVIRLARLKDTEARQEAILRSQHPSAIIRAGVANALGNYSDSESYAVLSRLMNDIDAGVRVQVIYAASRRPVHDREKLTQAIKQKAQLSDLEKMALHSSLLRSGV